MRIHDTELQALTFQFIRRLNMIKFNYVFWIRNCMHIRFFTMWKSCRLRVAGKYYAWSISNLYSVILCKSLFYTKRIVLHHFNFWFTSWRILSESCHSKRKAQKIRQLGRSRQKPAPYLYIAIKIRYYARNTFILQRVRPLSGSKLSCYISILVTGEKPPVEKLG